ncbi:MAG: nucleoside triphosphate pyrophosphohydrolase [Stappiaceae bacterium]
MKPSRDIETLLQIMAALRDRETGCPWDIEQDFSTIAPYTIEEAYEVADAIARKDIDDLREELGDLLLQVVFHAQMAQESNQFDFGSVVEAITTKLLRRHPHVFGEEEARESGMVKHLWESIKAQEKDERKKRRQKLGLEDKIVGLLDEVPTNHPALTQAIKLQDKAAKVGFDWPSSNEVLEKIEEEITELNQEWCENTVSSDRIEDEFGDILFAMANLARHMKVDPEKALHRSSQKFRRRFAHIEEVAAQSSMALTDMGLERMEAAWVSAKESEKKQTKTAN